MNEGMIPNIPAKLIGGYSRHAFGRAPATAIPTYL